MLVTGVLSVMSLGSIESPKICPHMDTQRCFNSDFTVDSVIGNSRKCLIVVHESKASCEMTCICIMHFMSFDTQHSAPAMASLILSWMAALNNSLSAVCLVISRDAVALLQNLAHNEHES